MKGVCISLGIGANTCLFVKSNIVAWCAISTLAVNMWFNICHRSNNGRPGIKWQGVNLNVTGPLLPCSSFSPVDRNINIPGNIWHFRQRWNIVKTTLNSTKWDLVPLVRSPGGRWRTPVLAVPSIRWQNCYPPLTLLPSEECGSLTSWGFTEKQWRKKIFCLNTTAKLLLNCSLSLWKNKNVPADPFLFWHGEKAENINFEPITLFSLN